VIPALLLAAAAFFAVGALAVLRSLSTDEYPRRITIDISAARARIELVAYTAAAVFFTCVAIRW
jgi:hypothetical protein